jgi:glycosyltransferase involved in cell wall biosynthesis
MTDRSASDRLPFRAAGEKSLSVVIPVRDEAGNVDTLHRELVEVLEQLGWRFEVLFVDDGSKDGTVKRLEVLAERDHRVRVLELTRNFGQTAALQAGFDHARGAVIVTLDGDLQNDPHDIPRLLAEIEGGHDVVSGWRRRRRDRLFSRRLPSVAANRMISSLSGMRVHDHGCALKAFRRNAIEQTALYSDMHRFVVIMVNMAGGRYRELVVNHRPRSSGRSKYGLGRVWKVLLDMIVVVSLRRLANRPGRWFLAASVPFALAVVVSVVLSVWSYLGELPDVDSSLVLVGNAMLCAFAVGHFVLLAILGELVVATGDYRESTSVLVNGRRVPG